MQLKLILASVDPHSTEDLLDAARGLGATGATIVSNARGQGLHPAKTFLGLDVEGNRDLLLFLVAEQRARDILEALGKAGKFDETSGTGIALQIAVEDAVGLASQADVLGNEIKEGI